MKVLILCSSIIPNGGSERAISNLSRILTDIDGIKHKIVSVCSNTNQKCAFEFLGEVIHLDLGNLKNNVLRKIIWYRRAIPRLKKVINTENPDIVLSVGHNISIMLPFITHKNCRTYACEHIAFDTIPYIYRLIIYKVYPHLSGVIVLSNNAKYKMNGVNQNIIVIPNCLTFNPTTTTTLDNKSIIMVGRISKEKGYDRLIPIAEGLKREISDWHINIYGDGPDRENIQNQIEEKNLSDFVTLHGLEERIFEKYPKNDILILTSYTEALPMVIVEANSFGLPVIGYENEGVNALVENEFNGFVVPSNNVSIFIDLLVELALDHKKLMAFSNNSLKMAKKYTYKKICLMWSNFLYAKITQD